MVHLRYSFWAGALSTVSLFGQTADDKEGKQKGAFEAEALIALLNTPITSAAKMEQRAIEAPSVIGVVTREQIQAYGWNSLNDILYKQPGFGPSIDFNHHTVSSRGVFESFPNNHLLHLVDGIPFNDPLYGTAWTWDVTPLFMAKTVEVLRGPGSALYGSNATNGVVHVKSLSAQDLASGGEILMRYSDKGERSTDFIVGREGRFLAAIVGFNTLESPGNEYLSVDGSMRTNADGSLARFMTQDHHHSQYLWAKLEGLNAFKGWTLQYHHVSFSWEFGQGNINLTPDLPENLDEGRHLLAMTYEQKGPIFGQEYLARFQQRRQTWYTREFPDGISAFGFSYPNGIWESVDTHVNDWFLRAQWSWNLPSDSGFLMGLEGDRFVYDGDRAHFSNINTDTLQPNPGGQMRPVGPYLEWIKDQPYQNTALFLQWASGKLLGGDLQATLGVRADRLALDYTKINDPGKPTASKRYANTSPRAALVYLPTPNFAVKVMVGKAFRAPAPIELGAAHSFYTLSNIEVLKPEEVRTTEVAVDWIINDHLNWRSNIFRTKLSNQIGYDSVSLLRNLYTLTTEGLEMELLYGFGRLRGFFNYAYARRRDEQSQDPRIASSPNRLTWDPAHKVNFGLTAILWPLKATLSGHYQGKVERRETEVGTQTIPYFTTPVNLDAYRPRTLGDWFTVDSKITYEGYKGTQIGLSATNLLDSHRNRLLKNLAFPYDYQGEGRRVSLLFSARF